MNKRVAMMMIVALVALLVAGGLAAAQSPSSPGTAPQAGQPLSSIGTAPQAGRSLPGKDPAAVYAVRAGAAAGGGYQLMTGWQDWSVRGAASGGSYRIEVVGAVRGTGTPCCCSYLPCALKGYR